MITNTREYVLGKWFDLSERMGWDRVNERSDLVRVFDSEIYARYTETHRFYHTLEHIASGLRDIEEVYGRYDVSFERLEGAFLFHDVVYDTHAKDSEEQSCAIAKRVYTGLGCSSSFVDEVSTLILLTKGATKPSTLEEEIMRDVDYAILGCDAARFKSYNDEIQQEYEWVPTLIYNFKRRNFFENVSKSSRIYYTDYFFEKYNAKAQDNIKMLLS